jgi:excinuclease ABC subunit A
MLDMTVEEAAEFFKAVPRVRDFSKTLHRVGLDYIHVGQQATTLSGGEDQRVKAGEGVVKARRQDARSTSWTNRPRGFISTTS